MVSNSKGSVTSSTAALTVNAAVVAPTITTQPTQQTITAGQNATFTVMASGTAPLSYQWQKNGTNISGATGSSYTTPATTTSDSGSTFDVIVSNSKGSVTSSTATLTVNAAAVAPTITTQPTSLTAVTAGQTATFAVVASGTAPLRYQWQKNGTNISGATGSSYTTPATTTGDNGSIFDVVVSNSKGNVTSTSATLTVIVAGVTPTITTQPASVTVTAGQTATFTVVASGTAPLSYQWQKNGTNISGATGSSYTTPATTTSDSGSTFDVMVSRGHWVQLHHSGHDHFRQRLDLRCHGQQLQRQRDQQHSHADGERCCGGTDDYHPTGPTDSHCRAGRHFHGGGQRDRSAQLPMAEERHQPQRGHGS
jgi:hypothetical protein